MNNRDSMRPANIIGRDVSATVKWFNRTKGFGFVQCDDGNPDAFLHVSVVARAGVDGLDEGAKIVCDLAQGPRGPQVHTIKRIDSMGEPSRAPMGAGRPPGRGFGGGGFDRGDRGDRGGFGGGGYDRGDRGGFGGGYDRGDRGGFDRGGDRGPSTTVEGKVKFFNVEKGFGFVTPDDGSKDVFVHVRALQKSGIDTLAPQQKVRVTARMGDKGPMAETVELL